MQSTSGAEAIRAAVERFYDRILADPALARYWVGVDVPRLRRHARIFVLGALGGPEVYEGDVAGAHRGLGIDDADFDRVAAALVDALREAGVSDDVVELGRRRVDELRAVIVTA